MHTLEPTTTRPTGRRTHLHAPLFMYTFIAVLVAIGAFTSQNNLLFWLFGLSLGMILVSGMIGGNMLMAVRATREVIADAAVPGRFVVRYRVSNVSRVFPLFALTIQEIVIKPDGPSEGGEGQAVGPKPGVLSGVPAGFVAYVPTRTTVEVSATSVCTSRGVVAASGFRISSAFPFGIISKSLVFSQTGSGLILPEAIAPGVDVVGKAAMAGTSDASMPRPGHGYELFGVREYQHGDTPRLVAWRATARTGELRVRQMAAETPLRILVVLCIGADATAELRERAVSLAAGCVEQLGRSGVSFALHVPGDDVHLMMRSGPRHALACLESLSVISGRAIGTSGDAMRAPRGAAMVSVVAGTIDAGAASSVRSRSALVIDAAVGAAATGEATAGATSRKQAEVLA